MAKWEILWRQRDTIIQGFQNTIILFGVSAVCAFLLGCAMALLIQTRSSITGRLCRNAADAMRMLPFLIYAYLLYYGLPSFGVRLDAWTASFIALITYHAAYFGEILRGAWTALPAGQTESARAHGFTNASLYLRIILPQLVLRSAPVLGNQLIICLKDTAFLMIITVRELTAASSALQSTYFIPFQAFIVAIGLYWLVSLMIEALTGIVSSRARERGLA